MVSISLTGLICCLIGFEFQDSKPVPKPPDALPMVEVKPEPRTQSLNAIIQSPCDDDRLLVEVEMEGTVYDQSDKVPIDVYVKNIGKWPVLKRLTQNKYEDFLLYIYDSKGNLVPRTSYGKHDLYSSNTPIAQSAIATTLNPGDQKRSALLANLVYDLSIPDEYTLVIEVPGARLGYEGGQPRPIVGRSTLCKFIVRKIKVN